MSDPEPLISVIIPFYNQLEQLRMTLIHLDQQTLPDDRYEVIVINDGSIDNLQEEAGAINLSYGLTVYRQDHQGPAAARNLGVKQARGEILLFLDADMLAEPKLLEAHLRAHENRSRVLIEGKRMNHLTKQTPVFMQIIDVDTNPRREPIDFTEILTCNLSVRKSRFLETGGFNERLIRWQDVEFSYRAHRAGFELVFQSEAVAYHEHPMSFQQYCEKQRIHHQLAWHFFNLHPEAAKSFQYILDKLPVDLQKDPLKMIARKSIRSLLALPPVLFGMQQMILFLERNKRPKNLLKFLYWKVIGSYQLTGLREGKKILST
jgi:GT2 family glycosyltransferase